MSDRLNASDLLHFTGSESLHPHWLGIHYTDGIAYVAERGAAYWLIDAVASYAREPLVKQEPFQLWRLARTTGNAAVLEMTDGDSDKVIVRQEIEYTDFPLQVIEMYCVDGVLMLVTEY